MFLPLLLRNSQSMCLGLNPTQVMAEELSHARAETESELASERALATAATSSVKQLTRANAELEAAATAANERCEAVREEAGRWSTQAQQVYGTVAEMEKAHVTMQTQLDNATAAAAQVRVDDFSANCFDFAGKGRSIGRENDKGTRPWLSLLAWSRVSSRRGDQARGVDGLVKMAIACLASV